MTAAHVANIASAAVCDVAYDQAANSHLLNLLAGLPLPGEDDFWRNLRNAAGTQNTYLLPANVKHMVSRAADGEGGLADHILCFINELSAEQRAEVAQVIGDTISGIGPGDARHTGELWLRDAEITAWRVVFARHRTVKDRAEFFEAWRNA